MRLIGNRSEIWLGHLIDVASVIFTIFIPTFIFLLHGEGWAYIVFINAFSLQIKVLLYEKLFWPTVLNSVLSQLIISDFYSKNVSFYNKNAPFLF